MFRMWSWTTFLLLMSISVAESWTKSPVSVTWIVGAMDYWDHSTGNPKPDLAIEWKNGAKLLMKFWSELAKQDRLAESSRCQMLYENETFEPLYLSPEEEEWDVGDAWMLHHNTKISQTCSREWKNLKTLGQCHMWCVTNFCEVADCLFEFNNLTKTCRCFEKTVEDAQCQYRDKDEVVLAPSTGTIVGMLRMLTINITGEYEYFTAKETEEARGYKIIKEIDFGNRKTHVNNANATIQCRNACQKDGNCADVILWEYQKPEISGVYYICKLLSKDNEILGKSEFMPNIRRHHLAEMCEAKCENMPGCGGMLDYYAAMSIPVKDYTQYLNVTTCVMFPREYKTVKELESWQPTVRRPAPRNEIRDDYKGIRRIQSGL